MISSGIHCFECATTLRIEISYVHLISCMVIARLILDQFSERPCPSYLCSDTFSTASIFSLLFWLIFFNRSGLRHLKQSHNNVSSYFVVALSKSAYLLKMLQVLVTSSITAAVGIARAHGGVLNQE